MNDRFKSFAPGVKVLTLLVAFLLTSGCAFIDSHIGESCKSRAHTQLILGDYLNRRFHSHSPVRLAIIPWSTAANISGFNSDRPGLGDQLAWKVHQRLLQSGEIPIVEVFNRPDWPGKKDEFFTGNYGALAMAREAGYDLVMVGYVESMRSLDEITTQTKLIEVDSGVTVWYGENTAWTRRPETNYIESKIFMATERLDYVHVEPLLEEVSSCMVSSLLSQDPVPK